MSAKQDRVYTRTAADLERKYNFGKTFAEFMGLADSAKTAAASASEAVRALDESLTSQEVFNRLTNNGAVQGVYRGEDGNLYVNASFVKSGTLDSAVINGGTLNITKGATIAGWDIDSNSIYKGANWGTSTFMCTGSTYAYSIGGSEKISGWVFGAGGKFGVTSAGEVYCSALKATSGCKLGGWRISGDSITSAEYDEGDATNTVWLEPERLFYMYNQASGYGIYATWEDVVKAANSYAALEARVAALES